MSLFDLFLSETAALSVSEPADHLPRYTRLRAVGRNLNHKLVGRLSKTVLTEGAKRIGIFQ